MVPRCFFSTVVPRRRSFFASWWAPTIILFVHGAFDILNYSKKMFLRNILYECMQNIQQQIFFLLLSTLQMKITLLLLLMQRFFFCWVTNKPLLERQLFFSTTKAETRSQKKKRSQKKGNFFFAFGKKTCVVRNRFFFVWVKKKTFICGFQLEFKLHEKKETLENSFYVCGGNPMETFVFNENDWDNQQKSQFSVNVIYRGKPIKNDALRQFKK